jgi:hypothetical protein
MRPSQPALLVIGMFTLFDFPDADSLKPSEAGLVERIVT